MFKFKDRKQYWRNIIAVLVFVLGLMAPIATPPAQAQGNPNPGVIPPNAKPYGLSYAEWSAKWWKWSMELPLAGNPINGCPDPPDAGQTGPVWFLSGNFGNVPCNLTIPAGKALFFPLINAECSSLEDPPFHGGTAEEQRECAMGFVNAADPSSQFCEIDGVQILNPARYRVVSPQFEFTAPTPWVFGPVGGPGTSVGDGYYLMLHPLPVGTHTLHFGAVGFIDTTFNLTVTP